MVTSDEVCKAVKITGLDACVTDVFLKEYFKKAGEVVSVEILKDKADNDSIAAVIEFAANEDAKTALDTLNGSKIYDSEIQISMAVGSDLSPGKEDKAEEHSIWVGNLGQDVNEITLRNAFSHFPSINNVKIIMDMITGNNKGYGFVSFKEKSDAEKAVEGMNGFLLGNKNLKINWAHHSADGKDVVGGNGTDNAASATGSNFGRPVRPTLDINHVINLTSPLHTSVYVGNIPQGCTPDMLIPVFQAYGYVSDVKCTPEKGFAFVKYDNHQSAAVAICYVNGSMLNGSRLKCSWGRDKNAEQAYVQRPPKQLHTGKAAYNPRSTYNTLTPLQRRAPPVPPTVAPRPQQMDQQQLAVMYNTNPDQYQTYYNYCMQFYEYMQAQGGPPVPNDLHYNAYNQNPTQQDPRHM